MRRKVTDEIILIQDRSGSMSNIWPSVLAGTREFFDSQKNVTGRKANITVVVFNNLMNVMHNRVPLESLRSGEYLAGISPSGSTALLDTVYQTIVDLEERGTKPNPNTGSKVIVAIYTDGQENASVRHSYSEVKQLIQKKQEDGWQFIFLASNINAEQEAAKFGIDSMFAKQVAFNDAGMRSNSRGLNAFASTYRSTGNAIVSSSNYDTEYNK